MKNTKYFDFSTLNLVGQIFYLYIPIFAATIIIIIHYFFIKNIYRDIEKRNGVLFEKKNDLNKMFDLAYFIFSCYLYQKKLSIMQSILKIRKKPQFINYKVRYELINLNYMINNLNKDDDENKFLISIRDEKDEKSKEILISYDLSMESKLNIFLCVLYFIFGYITLFIGSVFTIYMFIY